VVGDPPAAATVAEPRADAYSDRIGRPNTSGGSTESERLARRCFAAIARGETEKVFELVHPDVEIELHSLGPGDALRGQDAVAGFVEDRRGHFFEASADVFRPVDEERIVIEGRLRWIDEDRILRDDPVIWAFEFRDGLLFRSTTAQSVLEAEALLAGAPRGSER